jgi:cell wall-associated NlpC family hydrolase
VVNDSRAGRHRPASPYNPLAEISTILRGAGETGVKASAVLAASGGLVATFALPAQAAPSASASAAGSATSAAPTEPAASELPPALVAPEPVAPVAVEAVGVAGVRAVAKPKPAPRPAPVAEEAVRERTTSASSAASRSTSRPAAAPVAQSSSEIVNIARTLLGIAYVYGGSTPAGFDCSGFTSYVFGKAGISIPRTASEQQAAATPVSDPQPGDLVFYGSPAWHVGIYTGNGMMIDSPRPGKYTSERPLFSGVTGYGRF